MSKVVVIGGGQQECLLRFMAANQRSTSVWKQTGKNFLLRGKRTLQYYECRGYGNTVSVSGIKS